MRELVYALGEIFSSDPVHGTLGQQQATGYYIAPYQRGYKWASAKQNDPVNLLMTDLKDAFENDSPEYFLQYITVCQSEYDGKTVLEVIDGQQRLTTLTLLFTAIGAILKEETKPLTHERLFYEVRPHVAVFFARHIYSAPAGLAGKNWETFLREHPDCDEQDIHFLFHAFQAITHALPADPAGFRDYLLKRVKLIVNRVDKAGNSERIFANLNSNKVDLTSAELIKALLLTRSPRERAPGEMPASYRAIIESRALMGRQWDEMEAWARSPEMKLVLTGSFGDAMTGFLNLAAHHIDPAAQPGQGKNDLFNFFHGKIKRKAKTAGELFAALRRLRAILQDWWADDEIYQRINFLLCARNSSYTIWKLSGLIPLHRQDLKKELQDRVKKLLDVQVETLEYGEDNDALHRVLLALSVFDMEGRFNFNAFRSEAWSLEHIFPQHPKEFPSKLSKNDLTLIRVLLKEKLAGRKENLLSESLRRKLESESCELEEEERIELVEQIGPTKLNSIGNMALLTSEDNSSNSNGMFDAKRLNIVKRISQGSFVPRHTYKVFSKLISDKMHPDLRAWTAQDIDAHAEWIAERVNAIKTGN